MQAGDLLGIAGLVGAGRTELVRMIFGADRADHRAACSSQGKPVRIRGPRDAMRAGIVLLPEDRRHQGTVHTSPSARTSRSPTLRPLPARPLAADARAARASATRRAVA